jgi:hypothetical protein
MAYFRLLFVTALTLSMLAVGSPPLSAQYFGQNKVQYRTFDFKVLTTEHFDIYYYPEEEAAARDAARMAERWYARLARVLDHQLSSRQPLILYASHPHRGPAWRRHRRCHRIVEASHRDASRWRPG